MLLLRAVLNILVRNVSPTGPMMFRLSDPRELLFLRCCIASWTRVVVSVMLYSCIFCIALLMDLFVLCVACLTFMRSRDGSQVFTLLILFLGVTLHTMWLGKSMQLLCIFPFGILCLSSIRMMYVQNYIGCVCVGGYGGQSESALPCPP